MADVPPADKIASVRNFAAFATHASVILGCSYEEASVFVVKLGALMDLHNDVMFQAQLARFTHGPEAPKPSGPTPQGKGIH